MLLDWSVLLPNIQLLLKNPIIPLTFSPPKQISCSSRERKSRYKKKPGKRSVQLWSPSADHKHAMCSFSFSLVPTASDQSAWFQSSGVWDVWAWHMICLLGRHTFWIYYTVKNIDIIPFAFVVFTTRSPSELLLNTPWSKNRRRPLEVSSDILYQDDKLLSCCPWQARMKDALRRYERWNKQ